MERPLPIEPELLLSHAHWMRALARSLVHDASFVDDVVQESFSLALRQPPDADRPLHAWLARVVYNVAKNLRRGEGRRLQRELRHGVPEQVGDPAATIERLDTQQLVLELVRELDEPSRSTIVLAYFEGLSSPEIGRRMGVSDATVRWRMQKALAELRARLERKFGTRDAWCGVLAPFANSFRHTTTTTAASAVSAGAFTMAAISKVAVAVAGLAIVGACVWLALDHGEPVALATKAEAPTASAALAGITPVEKTSDERIALTPESHLLAPSAPQEAAASVPASAVPTAAICIRFVDPSGRALAGVEFRMEPRQFWAESAQSTTSTTSDAEGRAALSFPFPADYSEIRLGLSAVRSGCATLNLHPVPEPGRVVDLGDVVIHPEARVLGRVRDARGASLSGVTVGLIAAAKVGKDLDAIRRHGPALHDDRLYATQADALGQFAIRSVSAGTWRVWGSRDGLGYGLSPVFEVQPGEVRADVELELPELLATDTIRGLVLDPEGQPAAGALVSFCWEGSGSSGSVSGWSSSDGTFQLVLNAGASGHLDAQVLESRMISSALRDVEPGARGIVLQLARLVAPKSARLRVRGPAQEPVAGLKLQTHEVQPGGSFVGRVAPAARVLEPGLYEFYVPQADFKLRLSAPGYLDAELDNQGMALDATRLPEELTIELALAPRFHGRVTAAGLAVAQARIEAMPGVRSGLSLSVDGFPALASPGQSASATSGDDGEFFLLLREQEPVYLRCVAEGFAPTMIGPFSAQGSQTPVEIALHVGGAIAGRTLGQDGTPVVGAIVGITCGDGYPRTRTSGLGGVFRFEGLSVGPWLVRECPAELADSTSMGFSAKPHNIEWSCEVQSDRTTRFDLILKR